MEETTRHNEKLAKEIIFSRAIKAGKRIYYIDVKRSKNEELYLSITESKKIVSGEGDESQINFEKHKIFLYKEDFEKFKSGIDEAVSFIEERQGKAEGRPENEGSEIKIDMDF